MRGFLFHNARPMDVLEQIDAVTKQAEADLAKITTPAELEEFRIRYLSANGQIKQLMKLLGGVPKEQKPAVGQKVNQLSKSVTEQFEKLKESLGSVAVGPTLDVTEPGRRPSIGNKHILMKTIDELVELFGRMGFAVATGPEVEDEFHNFIALNIPKQHPARDPLDNFYLNAGDKPRGKEENQLLLRTQTSTVQIRVMEKQRPPIRVVIPGRVYRPDTHDDTHLSMFHQLEALVVDEKVTMVDLKSTILQFAHAYFGSDTRVRFRPSFCPFTEPSAEIDIWFPDKQKWIESGGCGMVHPNVLKAVNIDPDQYTGWAFGFGIERIAMRKYGINNIRLFVENDVRFLGQF
jgi:phenylalanyl-tRNA synthetase alpha chain